MVEHEIFLPQVAAHRSCQTDERTILVGSVFDSQSVPANRESPSHLAPLSSWRALAGGHAIGPSMLKNFSN